MPNDNNKSQPTTQNNSNQNTDLPPIPSSEDNLKPVFMTEEVTVPITHDDLINPSPATTTTQLTLNDDSSTKTESATSNEDILPPVIASPPKKSVGGNKSKYVATILGLLLLVGSVGAGVFLTQENQDVREKAATNTVEKCIDFSGITTGSSVEGNVLSNQNVAINAPGADAVAYQEGGAEYLAYEAPNSPNDPHTYNKCVGAKGGFALKRESRTSDNIEFTFPGLSSVSNFRLKIKDWGDFNPLFATSQSASITAYDVSGTKLGESTFSFTHDASMNPQTSSIVDQPNLYLSGDACTTSTSHPGNYLFSLNNQNITKVIFSGKHDGQNNLSDPNGAFAELCFSYEAATTPPTAQCNDVKAYDTNWVQLTAGQLSQLKPGDKVRFTVAGQASTGNFTKARFKVNGTTRAEVTAKKPGSNEFFDEYTIPTGTTSFSVVGDVYHETLGWK